MKCPECQNELSDTAKFCGKCGAFMKSGGWSGQASESLAPPPPFREPAPWSPGIEREALPANSPQPASEMTSDRFIQQAVPPPSSPGPFEPIVIRIERRHVAARGVITFSNFIGWLCVISLVLLPVGLLILLQGHLCLSMFETEENTRAQLALLQRECLRVRIIDQ